VNGEDQALSFVYALVLLMLVGSALLVRRIPMGQALKMFSAWALIFVAAFVAFTVKDDLKALGGRVLQEVRGGGNVVVEAGEALRIKQGDDGHFRVDGIVNGERIRFLIDSGATLTAISAGSAQRAGIEPSGGFPTLVSTANGVTSMKRGRIERIVVGSIERKDLAIWISEDDDMNVLGMNFLSSLSSWGVEGQWLVLKP
jgi:aspartyl protease family protein